MRVVSIFISVVTLTSTLPVRLSHLVIRTACHGRKQLTYTPDMQFVSVTVYV